jgi:hypothetical protein
MGWDVGCVVVEELTIEMFEVQIRECEKVLVGQSRPKP